MKHCPQCNRVETDDALTFCRADGATLVSDSDAVSESARTLNFGSSPVVNETETRILPPDTREMDTASSAEESPGKSTAPTTVLDAKRSSSRVQESSKPKARRIGIVLAVGVVALAASLAYYLLSQKRTNAIESIAVLPFVNESGNPEVEYLSEGMTDSLISSLSQLPKLSVKARSSVFRYKGRSVEPRVVGKELAVQAVLLGRVIQRGDMLTLSLELVDARTENVIWSEQYNRKQADIISLQNEVARDVSNKLRLKLSGADEQKLAKNYTANPEAYQLYLKGRFHWNKRTNKDMKIAIEHFQQAIAIEPNYALAYAGLADVYAIIASYSGAPPRETMPLAKEAALKALSLDDDLAEAHAALAVISELYDYDFAKSEQEFKRAIELNPNNSAAHEFYGLLLSNLGRHEEAFAAFRRALELDPLSRTINRFYGQSLVYARRYDEGIAQLKKTLELDANFPTAHHSLAVAYQLKGDYAGHVEEFAKYTETSGEPENAALVRESFARGGWPGYLRTMTGKNRPPDLVPWRYVTAAYHAALGEKEKAFAELNKSYEMRETFFVQVKVDPRLDPLHDDPRFAELLRKAGFPP